MEHLDTHPPSLFIPEQEPCFVSDIVLMGGSSFSTTVLQYGQDPQRYRVGCVALMGSRVRVKRSSTTVHEKNLDPPAQLLSVNTKPQHGRGAASDPPPPTRPPLRCPLSAQFFHNDRPTAFLVVRGYIVRPEAMQHPAPVGHDSWVRLGERFYRTLPYHLAENRPTVIPEISRCHGAL